jgi:lipopolysaccharide transport system ATP-binding protein
MSDVVIRAQGLGKKYTIGHQDSNERYTALRDVIARTAKGFAISARDMLRGRQLVAGDTTEEFWALKDVDFEIKRGEIVGVVGRNGAGKSTLLKVLSRITEPSVGRVEIKGRVASLLEVGTGFHPELSGRENIFLNGAILGMTRAEIKRKFDEIVAFAEIERFLDTPVKRYSSGMYVRLAFAVAAHLEPEILIVDEVLAVGDAEFQKKCLGKMGEVASDGRTVLFVSHNSAAIKRLCSTCILMKNGRVQGQFWSVSEGLSEYLSQNSTDRADWRYEGKELENEFLVPSAMRVIRNELLDSPVISIQVDANLKKNDRRLNLAIALKSVDGELIFWSSPRDSIHHSWTHAIGKIQFTCEIPESILNSCEYRVELLGMINNGRFLWSQDRVPSLKFTGPIRVDASEFWGRRGRREGIMAPILNWRIEARSSS